MAQQCTSGDGLAAMQSDLQGYAAVAKEMGVDKLQMNVVLDAETYAGV